jgi:hypothetical protein
MRRDEWTMAALPYGEDEFSLREQVDQCQEVVCPNPPADPSPQRKQNQPCLRCGLGKFLPFLAAAVLN